MHTSIILRPCSSASPLDFRDDDTNFPTRLPHFILRTARERNEAYGLSPHEVPPSLEKQLQDFVAWSRTAIQLDRPLAYRAPVQLVTILKQETCILAFLGFLNLYKGITPRMATLNHYESANLWASFISYITARGAMRGHVLKHVSLALKVGLCWGVPDCAPLT